MIMQQGNFWRAGEYMSGHRRLHERGFFYEGKPCLRLALSPCKQANIVQEPLVSGMHDLMGSTHREIPCTPPSYTESTWLTFLPNHWKVMLHNA